MSNNMKFYLLFMLFFVTICFSQTEISGELSGVLEVSGSPYNVVDTIRIRVGNSLEIEAGCELNFTGDYVIIVENNASLICRGTESDSIKFTCPSSMLEDDSRYDGIVTLSAELLVFEYCIIENGYSDDTAILHLENYDYLVLSHCNFRNNYCTGTSFYSSPIYFRGENLILNNTKVTNNYCSRNGALNVNGNLFADSCHFEDNESYGPGGAVYIANSHSVLFHNSVFKDNFGNCGGAVAFDNTTSSVADSLSFSKCKFVRNRTLDYGGAICVMNEVALNCNNCIFVENEGHNGGAIGIYFYVHYINIDLLNCTFYENYSFIGASMYISESSGICNILNTIMYNNDVMGNQIQCSRHSSMEVNVVNCLCNLDYLCSHPCSVLAYCLNYEPGFVDGDLSDTTFDLSLSEDSPCIDAGRYAFITDDFVIHASSYDIDSHRRPCFYDFDIGAYEYHGAFINRQPVIDCPDDIISYDCESDTVVIRVYDTFYDRLTFSYGYHWLDAEMVNDTLLYLYSDTSHVPLESDNYLLVWDDEYSDTCEFMRYCIPGIEDSASCDVDTVTIYVGSRNDTVDYLTSGISPEYTTSVSTSGLEILTVVDENLETIGRHYDYQLSITADSDIIGYHTVYVNFYDASSFRCVELIVEVLPRPNNPPDFYGCPDSLVILPPSEITFVYLQVEDSDGDDVSIELTEYPEPYEGFWNYREELYGSTHHIYVQFYPSYEDTGMHIFRFTATDGMDENECIIYTYVTKDTTNLCPWVEPETLYFEYVEGNPTENEITIHDPFEIHTWHIESSCDSILCVYPDNGFGTATSYVTPECRYNTIDLVFVLDVTGSMGVELSEISSEIARLVAMADSNMLNVRYGLAPFRDEAWAIDMNPYLSGTNMTSDHEIFLDSLFHYHASGGGDGPEVLLDAVAEAVINYDWSSNAIHYVIAVTDAPYHYRGDGSGFSSYITDDIDRLLLDNDIVFSIFENSYDYRVWYETAPDLTGGSHYHTSYSYTAAFDEIVEFMLTFRGLDDYLTDGEYDCILTYIMDYPVTCRSIDVPVIINILDSTETYNTYNCPDDTFRIVAGNCDTVNIRIDYAFCDSPYVELVDYPIDHVDMWTFEDRAGYNHNSVNFIFNTEDTDSGLYYYRIQYGNEFGSDTCSFFVRVLGQEPFYHFYEGWNLLSYPFTEPNTELVTLNPDSVKPYTWNASEYVYELPEELITADAFWLYSDCEMFYDVHYATISEVTTTLYAGWNMVSSTGDTLVIDILTTHSEIVTPVYYYNTNAGEYEAASQILPGIGYWLMSTETFEILYPE